MEVPGKIEFEERYEVCEPCCIEGTSAQANGYCEECGEYMCNSCFRDHLKSRLCRHHILSSLRQGQMQDRQKEQGTQPCQRHKNLKLRYYCRRHDTAACGDCIVADHKRCDMEFIKDVARNFETSSEFKDILENINRLQEECNKIRTNQEENRTDNKAMTEAALKEIRKIRKELNDYFDYAETEIINEAKRMSKENDDLVTELDVKLNKVRLDFDDLKRKLDTSLYKQDKLFIHYLECKSQLSDFELSIGEVTRNSQIKQFFFQPYQQLSDLMMSNVKLGTLKLTENKLHDDFHQDVSTRQDVGLAKGATQVVQHKKETKAQAGGATQLVQQKPTPVTNLPSQKYRDPDPRARGFDVGKRVKGVGLYIGGRTGTVTSVDPQGRVAVQWENGGSSLVFAGYKGWYYVELI